jgi:hypothetical protein
LALLLLLYLFIGTSEFAQSIGLSGDTAGIVGTLALMAAILSNFLLLVLIYHRGIAIGHVWLVALALLPALTFLISRVLGSAALFTFAAIGASLFLVPIVLGASLPSRKLAEHGA